jgi:hypothetical protein
VTRVPQRLPGAPPGDGQGRHEAGPTETATATAKQPIACLDGDDTARRQSRAERRGSPKHGPAFRAVATTARAVARGGPGRRYTATTIGRAEQGATARRKLVAATSDTTSLAALKVLEATLKAAPLSINEQRELRRLLAGRRPVHDSSSAELRFRRAQRLMYRRNVAADADQAAWRDAHDIRMSRAGAAPGWQQARAQRLWRDGAR